MSEQIFHPFLAMLVERIKAIDELYFQRRYVEAWDIMLHTLADLKEEDQNRAKDLKALIEQSIKLVNGRGGRDPIQTYGRQQRLMNKIIEGRGATIKQRFMKILWDGGYLMNEGYKQATPTAGDNISGSRPRKGLPKVMSSRVE